MGLLSRSRKLTGGEQVALRLGELGIDHVLSLPGSQVLPIWDAIDRRTTIDIVVPRSERCAAFMAEGYGRARGLPCVLMSTLGPGVANELVGIQSAQMGSAPVLCITPSHPPRKQPRLAEVFQGLDHHRLFAGICKRNLVVESDDAQALTSAIDRAYEACLAPPCGPVRLDISFPLLFQRRGYRTSAAPAPPPAQRAPQLLVISEAPAMPDAPLLNALGIEALPSGAELLSPGIGEPGFGLPFAVGAKLACPNLPVVLLTERDMLLDELGSLAVASQHGVAVQLITTEDDQQLARLFGIDVARGPTDPTRLARLILDSREQLTVVATNASSSSGS